MIYILAFYLLVHGISHLVGFLVPWKLASLKEMPYSSFILNGKVNLGHKGIRIMGMVWLALAVGYFFSIYLVFTDLSYALWFLWPMSGLSLVLCLMYLPDTKIGIIANLILMIFLGLNVYFGWYSN